MFSIARKILKNVLKSPFPLQWAFKPTLWRLFQQAHNFIFSLNSYFRRRQKFVYFAFSIMPKAKPPSPPAGFSAVMQRYLQKKKITDSFNSVITLEQKDNNKNNINKLFISPSDSHHFRHTQCNNEGILFAFAGIHLIEGFSGCFRV